jgi:hypothetical protein
MKILRILLICVTLISINSCKKYDDGGTLWRTKAKITDKTWNFDYASDSDTLYTVMDSWKTMQFQKNGDWVVNGNKWGTHNFVKDDENEKVNAILVSVDSSSIYWDTIAIFQQNISTSTATFSKDVFPMIDARFEILELKSKKLGIRYQSTANNHKIYYDAN